MGSLDALKRKERHESTGEAGIADPRRAGSGSGNFRSRGKEVAFSDSFRRFQAPRGPSGGKDHAGDREESRGLSNYGYARLRYDQREQPEELQRGNVLHHR